MPEITVASTTDTQEEIDLAAGADPVKVEEPEKGKESAETEEKAGEETQEDKKAPKSGFQKRIDKLTRQRHEDQAQFEQKLDAMAAELAALKNGKAAEPAVVAEEKANAKPKMDDFANLEDFVEALADWRLDQKLGAKLAEAEQEDQKTEAAKHMAEVKKQYNERTEVAREQYDDWDEVIERSRLVVPDPIAAEILGLENGPHVVYYLATHPEECRKLNESGPGQAFFLLGRLAASLNQAQDADLDKEEEPPQRGPKSRAPAPINPIRGSATKSTMPIDELPYSEYRAIRDKQEKARYRR